MTIEEFRERLNSGPTAEQLRKGFENHIAEIVNETLDNRDDLKEIKTRLDEINETLKTFQSKLDSLEQQNGKK